MVVANEAGEKTLRALFITYGAIMLVLVHLWIQSLFAMVAENACLEMRPATSSL